MSGHERRPGAIADTVHRRGLPGVQVGVLQDVQADDTGRAEAVDLNPLDFVIFAHRESNPRSFRVWFADHVTKEQGTGVVHTAPGHGADDFNIWVANFGQKDIPFTVDADGIVLAYPGIARRVAG